MLYFIVKRNKHPGRKYRGQWRHKGGLLRVQRMGQTKQAGEEIAGLAVQPGTNVLDKRGQYLVQQVSTGSTEATNYDRFP